MKTRKIFASKTPQPRTTRAQSLTVTPEKPSVAVNDDERFETASIAVAGRRSSVGAWSVGKVSDAGAAGTLEYRATDKPQWSAALLLGFQQTMVCLSGILVLPNLVAGIACAGSAELALRVELISATLVVTGVTTLIQTTFGLRLAILQGPSFAFVPPLISFSTLPEMRCNATMANFQPTEFYHSRLQTISGSLAAASVLLTVVGATGFVGVLSRRIGPITICPVLALLCLGNAPLVMEKMALHYISIVQFGLVMLCALYLCDHDVPLPAISKAGVRFTRYRLFGQFPYLLSIIVSWLFAYFLTLTNLEPRGGFARVDNNQSLSVLYGSDWLHIPYPGQFGMPQFSVGLFLGMLASCVACSVESLGAYGTLARVSEEKSPPSSTLNRAITVEGFGCLLSGIMGCGVGVTTYSENVAVVSVTKVASRYTMQIAAVLLVGLGIFTKFAALLATIPAGCLDPIVGGTFAMGVCMICGVSFSNLQAIDLKLSRNLTIIGTAIIFGVIIPDHFQAHPIHLGYDAVNQMLNILLTMKMFVGGFIAFLLDNTVWGATPEQRGLTAHHAIDNNGDCANRYQDCGTPCDGYAFPERVNGYLLRRSFINKLPFMPSKPRLQASLQSLDKVHETIPPITRRASVHPQNGVLQTQNGGLPTSKVLPV